MGDRWDDGLETNLFFLLFCCGMRDLLALSGVVWSNPLGSVFLKIPE